MKIDANVVGQEIERISEVYKERGNMPKAEKQAVVSLAVTPPRIKAVQFKILGTAPYMQARFSQKAMIEVMEGMAGKKGGGAKKREARDYDAEYRGCMHISTDGWNGIPATALRSAMISACRLVGYKMTMAKMSIFVQAEGFDVVDGQPLVRLYGQPESTNMPVRNSNGRMDIRVRPMWRDWYAMPIIKFDEDQFKLGDVLNLLSRAGMQVGIGEGRNDSHMSDGLGYGSFSVEGN